MDRVDGSHGWKINGGNSAGDNNTKQTAQKMAAGWVTALKTPRAANVFSPSPTSNKIMPEGVIQNRKSELPIQNLKNQEFTSKIQIEDSEAEKIKSHETAPDNSKKAATEAEDILQKDASAAIIKRLPLPQEFLTHPDFLSFFPSPFFVLAALIGFLGALALLFSKNLFPPR